MIENIINKLFLLSTLYVSTTRNDSFKGNKADVMQSMNPMLGFESFTIWDTAFKTAMEFNSIGVLRFGRISLNRHLNIG
jgi:hypothetical protein